ncbi:MAG: hypothetical protein KatS3mg061_3613 [Dehalococcoidia bacterium]|jgi:hypothetical protein|uniref:Uncharacterized protein n=1 Tax=Meiothermus ruber TaxID=277 RepID=A0A7C3HDB5_MEIRU|nr:MAG: hypothetical protein KatS3mg061_3613 [Dehalococcoidia bacterium]
MKKITLISLVLLGWVAWAQTAPFTDQDRIIRYLNARHPTVLEGQAYIAVLESTKVWVVNPGESFDWRRPSFVYATAWYDPDHNGPDAMQRVAFNGMPLERLSGPFHVYALKQPITAAEYESWISWYAFFSFRNFPQYVSADSNYGEPRFSLAYPPPYRLSIPDPLRIGAVEWSFEVTPAYSISREDVPMYTRLTLYPSRTVLSHTPLVILTPDPSNPRGGVQRTPPGSLAGSSGWEEGRPLQGYAGLGACNEKSINFEGRRGVDKVLVKACTLVVMPVTFVVVAR